MSYNIETLPSFDKNVKQLAKKYKSLKNDLQKFVDTLKENPEMGADLGNGIRKIRMALPEKISNVCWMNSPISNRTATHKPD